MTNESVVNLAASALTSFASPSAMGKHGLEHEQHQNGGYHAFESNKRHRTCIEPASMVAPVPQLQYLAPLPASAASNKPELKPFPFFHYRDHSQEEDPDPLTPLTFPGRVPNFPAKLHAILSRPDLADVIDWLPHGRSWRILKPREFETKVIPKVSLLLPVGPFLSP